MPFELANKKHNNNDSDNETDFNNREEDPDDGNEEQKDGHSKVKFLKEVDEVFQMVETIEKEQKEIFAAAGTRIIKPSNIKPKVITE